MTSARDRRLSIEASLRHEADTLAQIKGQMEQADRATLAMSSILCSFGTRLDKLEKAVIPVHRQTVELQQLQENIHKVMKEIDHVVSYHNIVKMRQGIINSGVDEHQLDEYCAAMGELQSAVNFFKQTSDETPELKRVMTLYNTGREKMIEYYKSLLTNHSAPLQPVILDRLLNSGGGEKRVELDFPAHISRELSKISNWLLLNLDEACVFTDLYGEVRARVMRQTLCDFYHYGQQQSAVVVTKRLTIKRAQTASSLRKSFRLKSKKSQSMNRRERDESRDETKLDDMGPFGRRVKALQMLIEAELELMRATLPIEYHSTVLDIVVAPALNDIAAEAAKFTGQLEKALKVSEYGALLKLCPCIDQLTRVSSSLMQTLHLATDQHRGQMGRLVREWESKAIELLDDFEDHVKSDQLSLPIDATVHQLNADTVHFVESVEPFHDSIGQMISRRDERATASATESYVNYKQDLLGALAMNLRNKASDYKSQSTRCLFLMNNFHFVKARLGQLYTSHAGKVLEEARQQLASEYGEMEEKAYEEYMDDWNRLHVLSAANIATQIKGKLSEKEKSLIKDKFRKYNATFEELITANRALTVTDGAQLAKIKDDIKQAVAAPYRDMLDKYGALETSKGNTSKYVKYTPETIIAEIDKIFDLSA